MEKGGRGIYDCHKPTPQANVMTVSMIEALNEEIEIKLSSLSVCCSSFQSLARAN